MHKNTVKSRINPLILKGVAHRGLFSKTVPENSIEAFSLAIKNNIAIELDVHLTKDNDLVVIHDEDSKRLTGKEGIVEDLTTVELQKNYRLSNGEKIPRFEEVLDLVNEQVPMLVELKVFRKNYKPLSKRVMEVLLPRIKDKSNFVFISFDPRSLWPLKKTGIIRLMLVAKSDEYTFTYFRHTVDGVDLEKVLFNEKRVQRFAKKHFINVWTIQSEEELKSVLPYIDTVTFDSMDYKIVQKYLDR